MADALPAIGWREWVSLPEIGIPHIKAKIDTGARTSALHAFSVERFRRDQQDWLRFGVHPLQKDRETEIWCEARMIDEREVADSGGHREMRPVILSPLHMGEFSWPVELTLTSRDSMLFRMLIGRTALRGRLSVDSGASFTLGGDKKSPPQNTSK